MRATPGWLAAGLLVGQAGKEGLGWSVRVLDPVADWDPRRHHKPTLRPDELTEVERNTASADDIELPI